MNSSFFNKTTVLLVALFSMLCIVSCQKDLTGDVVTNTGTIPDLTTKVRAAVVSGFVTDENDNAVTGASVSVGGSITSTDDYGFFAVKNVMVVKTAATVTVNYAGYFKGIKTFIAEDNKSAFFRIKLIPKTNSGSFNASTGGNVSLGSGLQVSLPADAVVTAASSATYSGTVNIAAHWIDPTAAELNSVMPGDLRGIAADGSIKILTSYGMAAVELTGGSGELLQVAPGKKATLVFPVPAAINGTAPASIPLWSFDEANGLWKEEGQATKTGNTYVAEVSHFSFWNCDVPNNYVQFNCTVQDAAGNAIPYALVKISVIGSPNNAGFGYTDSSGYVSGAIPNNAQLYLQVFTSYLCGTAAYSQNFSSANSTVSLGVITINATASAASVSGTVTDCLNSPVTNGYLIMLMNGQYHRYAISNTGTYSFTTLLCNNSGTATFIAEDVNSSQQSTPITQTLSTGANTVANLQACGVSIQEFITYTIDGGAPITFSWPTDSLYQSGSGTSNVYYISGSSVTTNSSVSFALDNTGIGVGSSQPLQSFYSTQLGTQTTTTGGMVNITEYGAVGEFISGNFNATVVSNSAPVTTYTIVCNFRVRRNF